MNPDYSQVTHEDEVAILEEIVKAEGANVLWIGDVFSILREHFNNQILDTWVARNPDKAFPFAGYED